MLQSRRYVLLDRDGTLIVERNYLSDPSQIELMPGAVDGLKLLQSRGFGTVIVTNQSGIGRGYFDEVQLEIIHLRLRNLLSIEGITIDGIYYCPHLPDDNCLCRKPQPGLVYRAAAELQFHPGESFVIGDKPCDIEMGRRIRAATVRLSCQGNLADDARAGGKPELVAKDLAEAAALILRAVHEAAGDLGSLHI
jgi:D-glycero-D-manno-heptose 1,7-bisphosphate phosphatase